MDCEDKNDDYASNNNMDVRANDEASPKPENTKLVDFTHAFTTHEVSNLHIL